MRRRSGDANVVNAPMCHYLLHCPVCAQFGTCPEISLSLTGVPDFRVAVRRRDGTSVATSDPRGAERTLRWDAVAGEKYGLFFEPTGASAIGRHRIGAALTRPREPERGRNVDR